MASITDLRQKRAALWEKTKKFLDNAKRENDMLSAEDVETYEKMESEIVALGKEIDILERQAEMEKVGAADSYITAGKGVKNYNACSDEQ